MSREQGLWYEFGPYRVDVGLSRLERSGTVVPVSPKAFDLLLLLARSPDRVLSKRELMEALWPNTFVEDANLTQHIYTLRKAVGDRPDGNPYIETVPRRGYRLNADVRIRRADQSAAAASLRPRNPPTADPRVASNVVLDGERKQATVLHCGVTNAAALAERFGPDGLDEAIGRLADMVAEEVGRYEGILRRRQADDLVALFGARVVHEDDARRAVLAALAIEQRLGESVAEGARGAERPVVRIGIDTGALVVSRRTDEHGIEYSAVGETMKVASLLQQLAQPGSIVISDAARRAVESDVQVEPLSIDSRATGVAAFRVVGVAPGASMRAPRPKRMLSEFVGRRHELALLEDLAALSCGGKGQVVNIGGEPGMGKSRLVHELTESLSADGGVTTLKVRCVSYGSLVPYLPLSDLIRGFCGISEADTQEAMRRSVARALAESDVPGATGAWLLRLIGIGDHAAAAEALSPEAVKARTFDALRTLVLKASMRAPLVIVVEDVHWIDRTSEEFLTTLAERLTAMRVMLIATCRPGYRAPWMDRSYVTHITLAPLTIAESVRLVNSVDLERPLPHDVAMAILERAEGNPFFLEELARAVVEEGRDPEAIPNTVHGVIMARLDRLSEAAKRLLQTASVVGREVPLRLLRGVWGGAGDFTSELLELSHFEFLYERPDSDDIVYVFKHALTRDVAYDSLLARNRRDIHLATARALQELYADRLDEMAAPLAYHYARTDLDDEAVTWLIRAADQAARVYANAEALLHLDLARRRVERLIDGPARDRLTMDVVLRRAFILTTAGRHKECLELLRAHTSLQKCVPDASVASEYFLRLAMSHAFLGAIVESRGAAEAALREAERAGRPDGIGKALYALAACSYARGAAREAVAYDARAIPLLREAHARYWLGLVYWNQAANQHVMGDFDGALNSAAECQHIAEAIGDPKLEGLVQCVRSRVLQSRGDVQQAIDCAQRALDTSRDPVVTFTALKELGYAQCEAGHARDAIRTFEGMLEARDSTPVQMSTMLALGCLGEAYLLAGEFDRAQSTARQALDMNAGLNPIADATAWRLLGRIALAQGETAAGHQRLMMALNAFEQCGSSFEAARTRLDLAKALASRGERNGISEQITAAIQAFDAAGAPLRTAQAVALADQI